MIRTNLRATLWLLIFLIPIIGGARCDGPNDRAGEMLIGQKPTEVDPSFGMRHHIRISPGRSPAVKVNAASGNLFLKLPIMNYSNPVSVFPIQAVYNSCPAQGDCSKWMFSYQKHLGPNFYTDETGARYFVGNHQVGDPIIGSGMIFEGYDGLNPELRSQNGWIYRFGTDGKLILIRQGDEDYPHIKIQFEDMPNGGRRASGIIYRTNPWFSLGMYEILYDAYGKVKSINDESGRFSYFDWSGKDLVSIHMPNDSDQIGPIGDPTLSFGYLDGRLSSYENKEGNRLTFGYDLRKVARVTQVHAGPGENPTHLFEYGNGLTIYTDPLGALFELSFSPSYRLTRFESMGTGSFREWTWKDGRQASMNNNGVISGFLWNPMDRLVQVSNARGNVTNYVHDDSCLNPRAFSLDRPVDNRRNLPPIVRQTDSLGLVKEVECDSRGRPILFRNGVGEANTLTYWGDTLNIDTFSFPNGTDVRLSLYNRNGVAAQVGISDSWLPDQIRTINGYGKVIEGTKATQLELGDVYTRGFDQQGRATEMNMRDGSEFLISYRSDGQRTYVERPGGGDSRLSYNELGRLISLEEFVDGIWVVLESYEHNLLGQTIKVVRANGTSTETAYDSDGNLKSVFNFRDGTQESWAVFSYEDGRIVSSLDSESKVTWPEFYFYDEAGSLALTVHPDVSTTSQNRDLRGRLSYRKFTDSRGNLLQEFGDEYDLANREVRTCDGVCDDDNVLVEHVFEDGMAKQVLYANGVVRTFTYEEGNIHRAESVNSQGVIEVTTFTYDPRAPLFHPNSSLGYRTQTYGGVEETTEETYNFTYNMLDCTDLGGGLTPCYEFDSQHNLVKVTQGPGGANLDTLNWNTTQNRLLSVTDSEGDTAVHSYDESGNRTSHGGVPITWAAHGKPASIGADETLVWSATGKLISRTVGSQTTEYLHGGLIRSVNGQLRIETHDFTIELSTGDKSYRHHDNRGNVKFVTNDAGDVIAHLKYGAFGLEEVFGVDQTIHFVGQDEFSNGLMLLGARLFDGYTFLSQDPLLQIFCQSCYTFGDPINWNDKSGMVPKGGETLQLIGGIAGATGAVIGAASVGGAIGLAAAPLVVVGGIMWIVGTVIHEIFEKGDIDKDTGSSSYSAGSGFADSDNGGRFDGPGNGSGGNSPRERWRQCICNGRPGEGGGGGSSDFGLNFGGDWGGFSFGFRI